MARYRCEDFSELQHQEGVSPAWPFSYEELEPWYCQAEKLYQVRGRTGEDPPNRRIPVNTISALCPMNNRWRRCASG